MFECPKCGKKDSSFDGETFCGPCESDYQRDKLEQERYHRQRIAKIRKSHSDDCDCHLCSHNEVLF